MVLLIGFNSQTSELPQHGHSIIDSQLQIVPFPRYERVPSLLVLSIILRVSLSILRQVDHTSCIPTVWEFRFLAQAYFPSTNIR